MVPFWRSGYIGERMLRQRRLFAVHGAKSSPEPQPVDPLGPLAAAAITGDREAEHTLLAKVQVSVIHEHSDRIMIVTLQSGALENVTKSQPYRGRPGTVRWAIRHSGGESRPSVQLASHANPSPERVTLT
jgi:hypothetical protein